MKNLPCAILFSCLGMLAWGSQARAQGGRIGFSGAVVEPTCGLSGAQLAGFGNLSGPSQQACSRAAAAGASESQIYALTVRSLATEGSDDRLLAYFQQNLLAASKESRPAPALVTQTYE